MRFEGKIGIVTGAGAPEIAHSGSFRPLPVTVHTTRSPASRVPCSRACNRPATLAADAGSTKTASLAASSRYADRICRSVTDSIAPPDWSRASSALVQLAGLPMRIAVAMVEGWLTTWPKTIGAAPAAWKPRIFGRLVAGPSAAYST